MLPAILSRVLVGAGARAAGGSLAAAGGIASAISGIGGALGGLADAASSEESSPNKQDQNGNVIYVNFGMAGRAGLQKVGGVGASIPSTTKAPTPNVSEKMPTEALLDTALKYLISIDKTLKAQLEFEKRSFEQNTKDQREAVIENKSKFNFSDIKEKLTGLKSSAKEGMSTFGKIAIGIGVLGSAAALIANSLDQTELDALKENVENFKENFGWLAELGSLVGAGGLIGFLFGGKGFVGRLKGGLVGMISSHVIDRMTGMFGGRHQTDENGNVVTDPQTGEPVRESRNMSAAGYALSLTAGAIALRYGLKSATKVRLAASSISQLGRAASSSSIVRMQAEVRRGATWLATRRGRMFLAILGRKLGRTIFRRLATYLARIVAGLLLTATGVGAIPGIIMTLASVAFIAWDLYDIATAIWDAWNESEEHTVTQPVVAAAVAASPPTNPETNSATAVSRAPVSAASSVATATSSAGGVSTAPLATGPVTNERILRTIRMMETRNRYHIETDLPNSSASGAYQFLDTTWRNLTKLYGIGTQYTRAMYAPPQIQDAVADRYASELLRQAGGDVSKIPVGWYTGSVNGNYRHVSRETVAAYQSKWMQVYNGRDPDDLSKIYDPAAAAAPVGTASMESPAATSTSSASSVGIEFVGKMIGILGSSAVPRGRIRDFTPNTSNVSERISSPATSTNRLDRINNESTSLINDITFGIRNEETRRNIESPTIPSTLPSAPANRTSISTIDPNYANIDILTRYVSHFRLAA